MTDKRRARAHYAEQARQALDEACQQVVAEAERYTALSAAQSIRDDQGPQENGERP